MLVRLIACVIAAGFCITSTAASLAIKPDSGVVLVWQMKTGSWIVVKDSVAVGYGDSMYLDDQYTARMRLGRGCSMLVKGELRLSIFGADSAAVASLDQGTLFFKRETGAELANVKILLRGCTFTPMGTAAAVKYTRQGEPTVAVLAGTVRIEGPKGEPVVATPGNFGTYDPANGTIRQGALPAEAIAFLEKWSETKLEQPAGTAPAAALRPAAASPAQPAEKAASAQPAKQDAK
jgi:hypothetical protein